MYKILIVLGIVLNFFIKTFGFSVLTAVFTMVLWNWLMPTLFVVLPTISLWQAFGLNLLCCILFKNTNFPKK